MRVLVLVQAMRLKDWRVRWSPPTADFDWDHVAVPRWHAHVYSLITSLLLICLAAVNAPHPRPPFLQPLPPDRSQIPLTRYAIELPGP